MKKSHKGRSRKREKRSISREHVKRGLVAGGTVTLATVGCSGCNDGGAVDPPPPPLVCGDIEAGQMLEANGTLAADSLLNVRILSSEGSWKEVPAVRDLEGLILIEAELTYSYVLDLQFELASDTTSTGSFTISGQLHGGVGDSCTVTRRFTVNIGHTVIITEARDIPLQNRNRARIEMIRQEGFQVLLRPLGAAPDWKLVWTVSEGDLEQVPEGVIWNLPSRPGLYQVELLTDHGDEGFGLDTLPMEVS